MSQPSSTMELVDQRSRANQARERAKRASDARKTSTRRRGVDPTTSERDYSEDALEFMNAMQDYKVRSGRMFPTWSEVLEVLISLGYEKVDGPDSTDPVDE